MSWRLNSRPNGRVGTLDHLTDDNQVKAAVPFLPFVDCRRPSDESDSSYQIPYHVPDHVFYTDMAWRLNVWTADMMPPWTERTTERRNMKQCRDTVGATSLCKATLLNRGWFGMYIFSNGLQWARGFSHHCLRGQRLSISDEKSMGSFAIH